MRKIIIPLFFSSSICLAVDDPLPPPASEPTPISASSASLSGAISGSISESRSRSISESRSRSSGVGISNSQGGSVGDTSAMSGDSYAEAGDSYAEVIDESVNTNEINDNSSNIINDSSTINAGGVGDSNASSNNEGVENNTDITFEGAKSSAPDITLIPNNNTERCLRVFGFGGSNVNGGFTLGYPWRSKECDIEAAADDAFAQGNMHLGWVFKCKMKNIKKVFRTSRKAKDGESRCLKATTNSAAISKELNELRRQNGALKYENQKLRFAPVVAEDDYDCNGECS